MDDLRQRSAIVSLGEGYHSSGVIKPLGKPTSFLLLQIRNHVVETFHQKQGKKQILLLVANLLCVFLLLYWCKKSNSMGLSAFSYLLIFDCLCLSTSILSFWVEKQTPNLSYTFGYERFEVLAFFASTVLFQLGALFIFKESFERLLLVQEKVEMRHGVIAGLVIGLANHLLTMYHIQNRVLSHAVESSSSSWLQEHVAEISQSLCHLVPGLSRLLLPRLNPLVLLGWTGLVLVLITYCLVDVYRYAVADTLGAMSMAIVIFATMYPMMVHSGRVLLQTVPGHIVGQLDKCLREASTLDGVLEFRSENFWTHAFGDLVGTVHVRIRRDANEQLVLAHLADRLSNLVKHLTIQVCKDDWTRNSMTSFHLLKDTRLTFPNGTLSNTPSFTNTTR